MLMSMEAIWMAVGVEAVAEATVVAGAMVVVEEEGLLVLDLWLEMATELVEEWEEEEATAVVATGAEVATVDLVGVLAVVMAEVAAWGAWWWNETNHVTSQRSKISCGSDHWQRRKSN
jgi:hypothetical protein